MECDGIKSCDDGSDEHAGCDKKCTGFLCDSLPICLPRSKFCDGTEDCTDASDEPADCSKMSSYEPPNTTEDPLGSGALGINYSQIYIGTFLMALTALQFIN